MAARRANKVCGEEGCPKTFINKKDLQGHINKEHPDSVRVSMACCILCSKKFPHESNMKRHIRNVHEAETWRFNCPHCKGTCMGGFGARSDNLKRDHLEGCIFNPHEGELKPELNESMEILATKQTRFTAQWEVMETPMPPQAQGPPQPQHLPLPQPQPHPRLHLQQQLGPFIPITGPQNISNGTIDPRLLDLGAPWERDLQNRYWENVLLDPGFL